MKDDPDGVAHAGADAADAVVQIHARIPLRPLGRAIVDGVAPTQRHYLDATLPARPLFGQRELTTREIAARFGEQDRHLDGKGESAALRWLWAIARDRTARGFRAEAARDVIDLVEQRKPEALMLLRAAGRTIGEVISDVVSIINPSQIVIVARWRAAEISYSPVFANSSTNAACRSPHSTFQSCCQPTRGQCSVRRRLSLVGRRLCPREDRPTSATVRRRCTAVPAGCGASQSVKIRLGCRSLLLQHPSGDQLLIQRPARDAHGIEHPHRLGRMAPITHGCG